MPFVNGKPSHQTGFKHTQESKDKIRQAKLGKRRPEITGVLNPNWKGDNISPDGGRQRAIRLYPCPKGKQRHHIDGNPKNNEPSNILILTSKEHMIKDGRLENIIKRLKKPKTIEQIERCREVGLANKGRKHTIEEKQKMAIARLGKKRGPYKKNLIMVKNKEVEV